MIVPLNTLLKVDQIMPHKYCLHHGTEYLPATAELLIDGQNKKLQHKENKLLLHFVTHPHRLITRQQLYRAAWPDTNYNRNRLNKVISTLRTKLKDQPRTPIYIKTIPKTGFVFISSLSKHHTEATHLKADKQTLASAFIHAPLKVIFWAFIILLFLSSITGDQGVALPSGTGANDIDKRLKNLNRITALNLSADNRYLVFSHQSSPSEPAQLVVKATKNGAEKVITQTQYHNLNPIWHPDGKSILYHRSGPGYCEIASMVLSPQLNIIDDQVLTHCDRHNPPPALSWGPDNSIFYTDIVTRPMALKIFQLNLDTGQRKVLSAINVNLKKINKSSN